MSFDFRFLIVPLVSSNLFMFYAHKFRKFVYGILLKSHFVLNMLSSCIQIVVKIIIIMVTLYIACFLQGLALKSYETYI
jgi:hypothetical protein